MALRYVIFERVARFARRLGSGYPQQVTKLAKEGLAVGALGSAGGRPPGDERFGSLRRHGPEHDSRSLNPSGSGWVAEDLRVMTSQKERTDSTVSK